MRTRALLATVCLALAACDDYETPAGAPATVATLTVAVDSGGHSIVPKGSQRQLVVVARDGMGNVLEGRQVRYTSSDHGVATVSAEGVVTAVGGGYAEITAELDGQRAAAGISVPFVLTAVNGVAMPATLYESPEFTLVMTGGTLTLYGGGRYVFSIDFQGSEPLVETGTYLRSGSQIVFASLDGYEPYAAELGADALTITFGEGESAMVLSLER